jgi:hypothetical protein
MNAVLQYGADLRQLVIVEIIGIICQFATRTRFCFKIKVKISMTTGVINKIKENGSNINFTSGTYTLIIRTLKMF